MRAPRRPAKCRLPELFLGLGAVALLVGGAEIVELNGDRHATDDLFR